MLEVCSGQPLIFKFEFWPEPDQLLWTAGLEPGHELDDPDYGSSLRSATVRIAEAAYGRFLAVLTHHKRLNDLSEPALRVTPENIRLYLDSHHLVGNMNSSIGTRMWGLRMALEIMMPEADFSWLTSRDGIGIRSLLPSSSKPRKLHHSRLLYEWGLETAAEALNLDAPIRRAVQHRNGLLIAMFASRAPRQRSMAALRLERNIVRLNGRYRMDVAAEDMKTGSPIQYDLPETLTPVIDHYLSVERIVLLAGQQHDWFWVGQGGNGFGLRGLEQTIRRQSEARFGKAFGTHQFRYEIGTIMPLAAPSRPAGAAAMLGSSVAVTEEYYNRGNAAQAARRFLSSLDKDREQTRLLAKEAFGQ